MTTMNKKVRNIRGLVCLMLALCILLGQFPAGVTAIESKEFSITGIKAYNFRGSDWYIILSTDNASFSLNTVVSLATTGVTVDGAATTGWFQPGTGTLAFDLDTDKAEHKVVLPAGMVLGEYTLKNKFVFYTHADGSVTCESGEPETSEPETSEPEGKNVSITGINAYNFRGNDWYIIVDTNIPDFALTSISGVEVPVDSTTKQVWFQVNSELSVPVGRFSFTLATDKAEHTVTIPAGTVLGEYTLKEDFVFKTHADGSVTAEPRQPEPSEPETSEPEEKTVSVTGIKAYNFRGSDWYIILNTDNANFSLSTAVSLTTAGVTVDGVATSGWFQPTTGTLEFDLDTNKAEHKVVIPAGTVLGEYTLQEEFVFYTHADGTVTIETGEPEPSEPETSEPETSEPEEKNVSITGIKGYNFRGSDWYIILNTDNANFSLSTAVSLTTAGVTVDGVATSGWFQPTTSTLEFDLDTDKAEHKVVIPAGTVLGEYTLKEDFVFYTHADGTVTIEAGEPEPSEPETSEPETSEPETKNVSITGIKGYNFRGNDWYIILETNDPEFNLSEVVSLKTAGVTVDGAAASDTSWFQKTTGTLEFTLGTDKAEHKVLIPAGTVLGEYTLQEEFVFNTHADGSVTAETIEPGPIEPGPVEPTGEPVSITGIKGYNFRGDDWYIILNIDNANFSLSATASLATAGVTVDGAAASGWFQKATGTLEFDLDTDKGVHRVVIAAGTVLGEYTLQEEFVFNTHADGSVTSESVKPEPGDPNAKPVSITGIQKATYRANSNDWYIILNTNISDFALTAISGLQAPVDDTTKQVWFQVNSEQSVPAGSVAFTLAADKGKHVVTIPAGTKLGEYILKKDFTFYSFDDGTVDTCLRDLREQKYIVQDVSELKLGLSEFAVKPGVQLIGDAKQSTNIAIQSIVSVNTDATEFNFGFSKLEGMWDGAGWQVWIRPKFNQVYLAHGETDWQATGHYEFTTTEFVVQIGTVDMHEYKDGVDQGLYCRKIFLKINGEEVVSYKDTDLSRKLGKNLYVLNSQDAVNGKLISLTSKGVTLREVKPTVYDYYDLSSFASDTIPGGQTILLGETQNASNVAVRMKMTLSGDATEVRLALAKQQKDNFWDEAGSGWQVWLRPKWDTAYIAHGTNDHEVIKPFPYAGTYTVEMGVRDVIIEKDGKKIGNYCRRVYLLVNGEEVASWEDMNFNRPIGNCVMLLTSQDSNVSLSTMKKTAKLPVETVINGQVTDTSEFVEVISQVVSGKPSKISVLYHSDYNNKVTLKGLYLNGTLLQPVESADGKQVYSLDAPADTDQLRVELEVKTLTVDEPAQIFDLFDTSGKAAIEVKGKQYGVSLGAMVGPEGQAEVNSAVRFRLQLPNQFNQVPIGILGDVSTLWGNSGALFQITPSQVHFCHTASMTRLASFASSWFAPGSNVCVELGIVKCYENGLYKYDRWYIKAGKTQDTMEMVAWYDSVERGHYGGHFSCNGTDMEQSYFLYSLKDIYTITDASSEENKANLRTYERWGENVPELYFPEALEGYSDVASAAKTGVISFFTKPGTKLAAFTVNGVDVTKDVQIGADGAYCYTITQLQTNISFAYEIAEDATVHTVTVETAPELEITVDKTQVLTGDDILLTVTAQKGYVPQLMVNGTDVTQLLRLDSKTGIWSATIRSIRGDTQIKAEALQRSYTLSVQENEYCTLTLGGDVADGKLPFGGTLELTVQIADGYYVEYILVGDQKLSVDQDGKLVLDQVYMDLQELVIQCALRQSSVTTTGQKNMTVVWISVGSVCALAALAGVFLLKRKTKRKADENEAK